MLAAKEGSGVRAKWIELPDCPVGLGKEDIALADDLSNAIIATCKSHDEVVAAAKAKAKPVYAFGEDDARLEEIGWTQKGGPWEPPAIYDPVMYVPYKIPTHEH